MEESYVTVEELSESYATRSEGLDIRSAHAAKIALEGYSLVDGNAQDVAPLGGDDPVL